MDKFGYTALDLDLIMEFLLFCLELHSWTMIKNQEINVKDRDDHTENVRAFKVEEDDWNFRVDR